MAQPPRPLPSEAWIPSDNGSPARVPPPATAECGRFPAASRGSRPASAPRSPAPRREHARARPARRAPTAAPRPGSGQRRSASEREKLRMRTLARALQELRRFLPPSVAPAGQSLTKIETLRLAIRYIGHLSAVLGLSEDSLQRPRRRRPDAASPRCCALCPDGGPDVGWGSAPARAAPSPRAQPVLRAQAARPQGQATRLSLSSPLFPCDVLALLETWVPLSPPEWPPA